MRKEGLIELIDRRSLKIADLETLMDLAGQSDVTADNFDVG